MAFEEVIDNASDGKKAGQDVLIANDESMKTAGNIIRPCSILTCILGHYLLFAPIIAVLAWIPLVGWLLASVVKVAAFIFAFVMGGTIATLTLGIAWVFFRPCVGITLLTVTGLGIACIWLVPLALEDSA